VGWGSSGEIECNVYLRHNVTTTTTTTTTTMCLFDMASMFACLKVHIYLLPSFFILP
jgi:hypothetical protein